MMSEASWVLEELVPHSGTMSLMDDVISLEKLRARAGVRISEASHFFDAALAGVPAWVGIEYMAQTVAMYAGGQARKLGERPSVGFLLGTRRFNAYEPVYTLGSYLEVAVEEELRDDQMAAFSCRIFEGDRELSEARLNVFQPNDLSSFLGVAS